VSLDEAAMDFGLWMPGFTVDGVPASFGHLEFSGSVVSRHLEPCLVSSIIGSGSKQAESFVSR
jgi:hypothetical protein